jgi:hypothetical protein
MILAGGGDNENDTSGRRVSKLSWSKQSIFSPWFYAHYISVTQQAAKDYRRAGSVVDETLKVEVTQPHATFVKQYV